MNMLDQVQKYQETTKIDVDMQNSVVEWSYHFSNLIMELMPQFIIMLPVLSAVKTGTPTSPPKQRALGLPFLSRSLISVVRSLIDHYWSSLCNIYQSLLPLFCMSLLICSN